ncbi:MAG: thioredoxin [Candidatus Latescibacterota bacterium]
MADAAPFIYDVNMNNFAEKVAEASYDRPVLVDFWATWCGPCKTLGPLLERVVTSYEGKIALARVNVDENRELAAQFAVKSIPTVKIVLNGAIADEFVGAIPEQEIRAIIDALAVSDVEEMLAYAAQLVEQDQFDEAESIYASILDEQPDHSGAHIGLARLHIRKGRDEEARKLLTAIPETDGRYGEAQALLGLFDFLKICEQSGGLEKSLDAAGKNPGDLEMQYTLGCCYAANNSYRPAFETFLALVKKDRQFGEGKAHKALLTLFSVVGPQDELTEEFRKKLAMELF